MKVSVVTNYLCLSSFFCIGRLSAGAEFELLRYSNKPVASPVYRLFGSSFSKNDSDEGKLLSFSTLSIAKFW
ncbi:uncharacterized protein C8R40DRAFT_1105317 [Lentinula edodes]|uniref:uncharacterized protein n=1 Tax=Lentinula edodes TaxID=5353 RepID=UPI001E8D86E6|nr:uncharacterized protein C8R40DRAFT_1105317 [Lentinula edodes]KAH7875189.1 hypothetical protein C8R40DRAFT_1105317 [Lentinula edodes]